ncbi:hypothetical protein MKW92_050781 [Papaver armeniacum]|nr:hypothetical protein MKW92_050781 [Papaver armeniacum]
MMVTCGSLTGLASGTTKRLYIPSLNGFFKCYYRSPHFLFISRKMHVLIACRSHGVGISKWGAFGPAFTSRSMTIDALQAAKEHRDFSDIQPGYTFQLKVEVPENNRRVSTLKGTLIARRNEMEVLNKNKARRAKPYYLRNRKNALKKE